MMYSKEVQARVLELVEQGHKPMQIAAMFGGSPSAATIYNWTRGNIPVGKRRPVRYYPLELKVQTVKRLEAGENYVDIAEELGCNSSVPLQWKRTYAKSGEEGLRTRLDRYLEDNA